VTRAWVYPPVSRRRHRSDVLFVMDARVTNIPLAGDITAVQASIDCEPAGSPPTLDTCADARHA